VGGKQIKALIMLWKLLLVALSDTFQLLVALLDYSPTVSQWNNIKAAWV
jgi:hypothetical protein